jgi:hypothetical protein
LASLFWVFSRPDAADATVAAGQDHDVAYRYFAQFRALQNFNSDQTQNGLGKKNPWEGLIG